MTGYEMMGATRILRGRDEMLCPTRPRIHLERIWSSTRTTGAAIMTTELVRHRACFGGGGRGEAEAPGDAVRAEDENGGGPAGEYDSRGPFDLRVEV